MASPASQRWVGNRVLMTLLVAAAASVGLLPFAGLSPNRLASGQSVMLWQALASWQLAALALIGMALLIAALAKPVGPRASPWLALAATLPLLALDFYGLGDYAHRALVDASPAARVSQGATFWILLLVSVLIAIDALQRLRLGLAQRALYGALALAVIGVCFSG